MSKPRSQTIRIFLPSGNPRGIRKVERTSNSNIRLIEIPRTDLHLFYEMKEAGDMGIYFLVGGNQLYIGQTMDLSTRIKQHDKTKAFWQRAFIVVLNNDFRTLDHLYCLEKTAIEHAQAAGRFSLENGTAGNTHRHLHDSIRSDCENIFDEIDTLLAVLNQDFFEAVTEMPSANTVKEMGKDIFDISENISNVKETAPSENMLFYCKTKENREAVGFYTDKAFVLCAGSLLRKSDEAYLNKGWKQTKDSWIQQGILADSDEFHWELTRNCKISSPSQAAALVVGGNRDGWKTWKTRDGKTLDEIYRKNNPKAV